LAKDQGYDPIDHAIPHMITKLPTPKYNLRERLGMGENKKVFGYLGGSTEFNIRYVQEVVERICKERNDIVFLFMNITKNPISSLVKSLMSFKKTWFIKA
jgi:phosphosulfolactate synthase (CoM biosynthesis protein A)